MSIAEPRFRKLPLSLRNQKTLQNAGRCHTFFFLLIVPTSLHLRVIGQHSVFQAMKSRYNTKPIQRTQTDQERQHLLQRTCYRTNPLHNPSATNEFFPISQRIKYISSNHSPGSPNKFQTELRDQSLLRQQQLQSDDETSFSQDTSAVFLGSSHLKNLPCIHFKAPRNSTHPTSS